MIFDKSENLMLYKTFDSSFEIIARYIEENDLKSMECGGYDVAEGIKVNLAEYAPGKGGDYECHREYHDLQLAVKGCEFIEVIPTCCGLSSTGYKPDIEFFKDKTCGGTMVSLDEGTFAFLAPGDAHKPCIKSSTETIKKAVFKIKINKDGE